MTRETSPAAELFRLKPTRAATVSEISEATAASAVPPDERVNFHIGNPVQDPGLSSAMLRAVAGLDITRSKATPATPRDILAALGEHEGSFQVFEFLGSLVSRSAPYLPRGGFLRTNPPPLIERFAEWLAQQAEPLTYDPGKVAGRREIVLASGGIAETLRVLFHALSRHLARLPARVLLHGIPLPAHCTSFDGLSFETLPVSEPEALERLKTSADVLPQQPVFVVLGQPTGEGFRRALRSLSLRYGIFFVEANDAPNHLSLAREARLVNLVLRLLTPGVLAPHLRRLSIVFVAGNAEFCSLLETVHFQLKGTPSASEVELTTFLLGYGSPTHPDNRGETVGAPPPPDDDTGLFSGASRLLAAHSARLNETLDRWVTARQSPIEATAERIAERVRNSTGRFPSVLRQARVDRFAHSDAVTLVHELAAHTGDTDWASDLVGCFLGAFAAHHPEYDPASCVVTSGSSRTALGLLGFHCGITEVVTPDLSWTYEHCFPEVHAVPLTPEFQPDARAILGAVDARLAADPAWKDRGAVVLNNPHNATGKVFEAETIRTLLRELLERGVTVIDDLAYQNVAPVDGLPEIPTVLQTAQALMRAGLLSSTLTDRIITVHSLSKTDCLAGARLSVVEIRRRDLLDRFRDLAGTITPNIGAILLGYLFYRTGQETPRMYWRLRNRALHDRMSALSQSLRNLPADRNPYGIDIVAPTGSMYPLLTISRLPPGLSLDWVASGLARQGIGMIPLSTFARTEEGFEAGRKAFRLTLGGTDGPETLLNKTRRVLIDLNRLIDEEQARYRRRTFTPLPAVSLSDDQSAAWAGLEQEITSVVQRLIRRPRGTPEIVADDEHTARALLEEFLPGRLAVFRQRFADRWILEQELLARARSNGGRLLTETLETELYKDNLRRREEAFRLRIFDRTVHPTQMYSIGCEAAFDSLLSELSNGAGPGGGVERAARELLREFFGKNVPVSSTDEADEILLDLNAHVAAEITGRLQGAAFPQTFLSFWGDWDGSTRPSGQGHRLVASVILENIRRLSRLVQLLAERHSGVRIAPAVLAEVERLPRTTRRFVGLLNEITALTHHLEGRYRGLLPFHTQAGRLRRLGMALHVARDPVTSMWQHNDRLERRMRDLRLRRRRELDALLGLNKLLRKELHALIPAFRDNADDKQLLRESLLYRDLLRRFVITPRIHQGLITAQDPFAIDTTVFNINEINDIGGRHGNPGLVLGLQVSMATRAEAIITLDRKLRAQREEVLRDNPGLELPTVWSIPLFEGPEAVRGIAAFLDRIWEYALQSRRLNQDAGDRFAEIVPEVFFAGSDLSQMVGQAPGAQLYSEAKHALMLWLAGHGLSHSVRIKLGSGEPMQRQGGYYSPVSGEPAFDQSRDAVRRFTAYLRHSTRTSTRYATTPMMGLFSGADLRTFQSALSETVRYLSMNDRAQLFHHVAVTQRQHRRDLTRACEELVESRMQRTRHGAESLERLTLGTPDPAYREFLGVLTENFRRILYGREEDVVGIHIASYFVGRTTPPLRDRPTVRPAGHGREQGNRILERIAATIPLSNYGSLLRAIAHNQAQTAVLGVNQLTTGLFRAIDMYLRQAAGNEDPETFVAGRILPHLPVYEILESLRLYHDREQRNISAVERAFPAGNSAFVALREDVDAMATYLPLFQQELLRRHGIDVADFFEAGRFIPDLLPTLRPDLAILLQPDLFNTHPEVFRRGIHGRIDERWLTAVTAALEAPDRIRHWRSKAWSLLADPVLQRVESFVDLAVSLHGISTRSGSSGPAPAARDIRLPSHLANFFRITRADDEMRQFLAAAMDYLSSAAEGAVEIPANIARALKEVERIARIEEQALDAAQQDTLRFYLLQIARIAGENG